MQSLNFISFNNVCALFIPRLPQHSLLRSNPVSFSNVCPLDHLLPPTPHPFFTSSLHNYPKVEQPWHAYASFGFHCASFEI